MGKTLSQGDRAYLDYLERQYDLMRDLHAAYQADTGRHTDVVIPRWRDLSTAQRSAFSEAGHQGSEVLIVAMLGAAGALS